jgi:mono/diheme cytochrome c family protein
MHCDYWRFGASSPRGIGVAFAISVAIAAQIGCQNKQPTATTTPSADTKKSTVKSDKPITGTELYAQHCAACHGAKGDGKGLAATFVFPKPRDFRSGRFRLVSTSNGVPTLDDISAVLRRGMPGSSMPPWAHLGDNTVKLLAEQVLAMRREGAREIPLAAAAESGDELSEEELKVIVSRLTTPGDVVDVVDLGTPTPESLARGKELYATKGCIACHGTTGKGDGVQQMVDSEGLPTRARDLTRGIFKGSPDPASVWRRIWSGMPGTPMPASQSLTPRQIGDLSHFVLSLSDETIRNTTLLTRQRIVARHVAHLPTSADSPAWQQTPSIAVPTVPLWWRDDVQADLSVQALHDGKSISLRLTWADAHADQDAARSEDFEDAVAVELFRGGSEPFFGMGAAGAPIDMWFWDADRQSRKDVEDLNPNLVVDLYPLNEAVVATAEYDRPGTRTAAQPPVTLPAVAAGNEIVPGKDIPAASSLETAGPGSVTFRPVKSQLVQAHGQWADGRWTVLMTRTLEVASSAAGVSLEPGAKASLAFAIWDGGAKDRDGKKLVSIWQELELERKKIP